MEVKRANKDIGSSLEADLQIYLNDEYLKNIEGLDLSEQFITSKAVAKQLTKNDNFFKLDGVENIQV